MFQACAGERPDHGCSAETVMTGADAPPAHVTVSGRSSADRHIQVRKREKDACFSGAPEPVTEKPNPEITTTDVPTCLTPIWSGQPATARALHQRTGVVMRSGIAKGYPTDNATGRAITEVLHRTGGHVHHRALPHSEVGAALAKVQVSGLAPAERLALELLAFFDSVRSPGPGGARSISSPPRG